MKRVSEVIKIDDIRKWKKEDTITITAGTGQGKSYFIKNSLYLVAKEQNKKILFLIHRANCKDQFLEELIRDNKSDTVKVMTYQKVESIEMSTHSRFNFEEYDYIVCDEFHYFISDSAFNFNTDVSFDSILNAKATKIFMSATGDMVKRYINKIKKVETIDFDLDINHGRNIETLRFYTKDNTLEDIYIKECLEGTDKAIFFINSAEKAYDLYKKYPNSLFNCSKSHNLYQHVDIDKIKNMLIQEKFNEQILFTTTCMDAGVNICDESVKHIVIDDVLDFGTIVQCMGRKRIQSTNDKVHVYIKNINNNRLGGRKTQIQEKIELAKFFRKNDLHVYIEKYGRGYTPMVYDVNTEERKKLNELAYFKCLDDMLNIDLMLNYKKNGFSKLLSKHLGIEKYHYTEEQEYNQSLEAYLESLVGKKLFKDEQIELINRINLIMDGKQLKSAESFNASFKEKGMPYIINIPPRKSYRDEYGNTKKYKTHWIVCKIVTEV